MYKKRYVCQCAAEDSALYKIEIYQKGNHIEEEVRLAGEKINIERTSSSQLDPITVSKAILYLYADRDGDFEELSSTGEHGAICMIYKNGELYYIGSLDSEQWSAPYSYNRGYITKVTFSDLSPLKRLKFTQNGLVSVIDLLRNAIRKATYPSLDFGHPTLEMRINLNVSRHIHKWSELIDHGAITHISEQTVAQTFDIINGGLKELNPKTEITGLDWAYIDTRVFQDKEDDEVVWYNVLEETLKALSLYIVQRNGRFFIYDIDALTEIRQGEIVEELQAAGIDAEISAEPSYNKITVEVEKKESTELYKHAFVEEDFGDKIAEWDFNRLDLELARVVKSNRVSFFAPRTDNVIRGGALYCKLEPHTLGSEETFVCVLAAPRNEYVHKTVFLNYHHQLPNSSSFSLPETYRKSFYDLQGQNGVYCTPIVQLPTKKTEYIAGYKLALSLALQLRMDYSLTQSNSADPKFDEEMGKHLKKIFPKKIKHVYVYAIIRAVDEKGNTLKYLSNYDDSSSFIGESNPFIQPVWVDKPTMCTIEFGAEEFQFGSFVHPNEQQARYDLSPKYGEVFDNRFMIPLPPVGCGVEAVITDRIQPFVYDLREFADVNPEKILEITEETKKLEWMIPNIQWVLMKGLALDLVRYDGRDYEHKKIQYKSCAHPEAFEHYEEKILLDTSDLLAPTSFSALKDVEGRKLNSECTRGMLKGTLGELYVSHVFSRTGGRHLRLTGTYKTISSIRVIEPHKKKMFRLLGERERTLTGKSELTLVEINSDKGTDGGASYAIVSEGVQDASWSKDKQYVGRVVGSKYKESIQPVTLISSIVATQEATSRDLSLVREEFVGNLTTTVNNVVTERRHELKGEKGEDGRSVSIEDLGISWQDSQLVIGGVVSPILKGDKGEDAPVPDVLIGSVWESGYIDENDGTTIGGSGVDVHCPEYYPIYSGADIRLTSDYVEGAIGGWSLLFFYDKSKEFISATRYTKGRNAVELSLKAPDNAYYLRLSKLSSAHVVRLYTLLRGVQISDLTANTEFMQHTARKVSEVGRFVSETALNSALADKVNTVELANYATTEKLAQELSKKQNAGDYVVSSYFSSELSKTNTAVSSVETRAIRPVEAVVVGASTSNPFSSILGDPNGNPRVCSINVVEGTDIYLPPAQDCAVGTKIYLRGSAMTCPVNPYHHNTTIRPIRIFSSTRDVYSAGRYYTNNTLLETFTNAEWRVDLECIVAGCGLKGWLWTNSVESKNLLELSSSITTAIQSIAETRQDLSNLKNNVIKKGEGIISGFYNLRNSSTGAYTVKATDYHILARTTANGDTYPYIRVDNSLPVGHQFIVDMPFSECRVRFIIPSGATTWGNGGTEWNHGYRYHVTKSWSNEWGVVKTAYAQ